MLCTGKIVGAMTAQGAQFQGIGRKRCMHCQPTAAVSTTSPLWTLPTGRLPAHALRRSQSAVEQSCHICIPFAAKGTEAVGQSEPLKLSGSGGEEEVSIRRRPPFGSDSHGCGPLGFKVDLPDGNEPRNILEEIVWWKAREVDAMRDKEPLAELQKKLKLCKPTRDFKGALSGCFNATGRPGLIAEVKKASPSKGVIQPDFDPVRIAKGYEGGGAACLSVLTDSKYFQGSFENLGLIRRAGVACPLLCKEFIVEAYQLFKARVSGADAVLLIAAVLPNKDLTYLLKSANALGLQCLVEVHNEAELARILRVDGIDKQIIGINNRDLTTFKVDLHNTKQIMESEAGQQAKEREIMVVGESGIFTPEDVQFLLETGCQAILVGESIVKKGDPRMAVATLLGLS